MDLSRKNVILKIRKFDDTIINILNAEIPTESFYKKSDAQLPVKKCQQFKQEVKESCHILISNNYRFCIALYY